MCVFFFFFFLGGGGGGGGGVGGHHEIGLHLVVISMHFRVFLRSRYRMGDMLLGCQNFKKKLG